MLTAPDIVFVTAARGLVARSGWDQEEARTVLLDLGWQWEEELHALIPPDGVPEGEAGLQAVEELRLRGHRTGYSLGPYGAMTLTRERAERVFLSASDRLAHGPAHHETSAAGADTSPGTAQRSQRAPYGERASTEVPSTTSSQEPPPP